VDFGTLFMIESAKNNVAEKSKLQNTNTKRFILSRAYINNKHKL